MSPWIGMSDGRIEDAPPRSPQPGGRPRPPDDPAGEDPAPGPPGYGPDPDYAPASIEPEPTPPLPDTESDGAGEPGAPA
jgi:hypothetical protein